MSQRNPPEIATVAKQLVSAGTPFIAAPENVLADDRVELLYFLIGQNEELSAYLYGLSRVTVGSEIYPITCVNVLHSEVHFARRLPIYACRHPILGLSKQSLDDGIEQLRKWLSDGRQPIPPTPETAPLCAPLQKLIIGGAVAISLEKELTRPVSDKRLSFAVHGPPAIGAMLVDQYEAVVVDGDTYDVEWLFTIDGPATLDKVAVYADDGIPGMNPVSLSTGEEKLRDYLQKHKERHGHGGIA